MANTVIALKKSATPLSVPANLANGELAINYADGKLYYKAANGTIASISGNEPNYFGTVNANNTLVVADTPGDVFTLASGNNIAIIGDAINDKITISLVNDVVIPSTGTFKVSAVGNDEGGEIKLGNAVTNSVLTGDIIIDIFQNRLRFFESGGTNRGAFINLASASTGVGTDLLASSSGTDTAARTTANAAFLHANAAFSVANAALPNVSGVSFNGNLTVSQNLSADRIFSTNNGLGENFKVGDDAWIGDFNIANSIRIKGQQNSQIGYVVFGDQDGKALGRAGTGALTYDSNTVWHAGNDGAGSGLDADLLDGQHGSYYGIATDVTAAFAHANQSFNRANTANITADRAFNHANAAFITANIAFANANTVMISAQAAFTVANAAFLHANSGYAFVNSISLTANAAFLHANAAFANGNTVIQTAQSAFNQANISFLHANAAFASANAGQASGNAAQATANASYAFGNSAHSIANLAFAHANAAFAVANTSGVEAEYAFLRANLAHAHANAAFLSSNSVNTYTNSTFVKLTAASQTITGNVNIVGDLTLSGNTFTIDATRLEVDDPLLYLAANNYTSDIVDIGFIANYVNATGQNVHTGLYREHEDKMYYLFQGYDKEPINNHIGALSNNMTLAVLNADLRTSNLVLGGANAILTIGASFNHANAAHASANAGQATANAAFARANLAHAHANAAFATVNSAFGVANTALPNTSGVSFVGNLNFPSGSVGIGTNVANSRLTVIDNIAITAAGGIQSLLMGNRDSLGMDRPTIIRGWNGILAFGNGNSWSSSSGGTFTEFARIDASGNLGIGTTSPGYKLDVNGAFNTSSDLISQGDNARISLYRSSGINYFDWASGQSLYFSTQTSAGGATRDTKMILDASGNVGIGRTNPGYKLDVVGTANASNLLVNGNMVFTAANDGSGSNLDADLLDGQHGSYYGIASDVTAAFSKANTALPNTSGVAFNGNLNLPTGNLAVGIATPNTGARLQVYNTTGNSELWITADNGFDPFIRMTGEAGATSEGFFIQYDNSVGDTYFKNIYNGVGAFHFQTFAVEAFTIQTDGKVGVGTTSPGYILDVKGTGNVSSSLLVNNMNVKPTIEAAFASANAGQASANAGQATANAAFARANLAHAHANASYAFSNSAHSIANLAFTHANAAFASSNADYAFSNSAHSIANLAFTHANAAFDKANSTTYTSNVVIDVADNTNAALRITQTGSGLSLVVEDSTSPDATPFAIDNSGRVIIGSNTAYSVNNPNSGAATLFSPFLQTVGTAVAGTGFSQSLFLNSAAGPSNIFAKSRGATVGTATIVQVDDVLGHISWQGDDGQKFIAGAAIQARVDATPTINCIPSRISFHTQNVNTTNLVFERVRIESTGNVLIGRTNSTVGQNVRLDVAGAINASAVLVNGTALTSGGATLSVVNDTVNATRYLMFANGTSGTSSLNVAVGLAFTPSSNTLNINGALNAVTKSFVIPHPVNEGMFLRYGSLEGPENGVYVRGKIEGKSIIELPEYWWNLIDQDTITVNLTPYGRSQDIWVQSTCAHFIHLNQQADCFFTVFAERKDVDKLVVEY